MRFFIALEIPRQNLAEFQAIQSSLHTLIPQIKLTTVEKIHLTLAFLGEQPAQLTDNLVEIIKDAAWNIPNFKVTPAYIDGFPTIHYPQILWVGVKGDIDKIFLIREGIKDRLENLGLPVDERRFIPHISIAKLNNFHIDMDLESQMEKTMMKPFRPIEIASVKLFESVPAGTLHKHNTLAEIRLTDNSIIQNDLGWSKKYTSFLKSPSEN